MGGGHLELEKSRYEAFSQSGVLVPAGASHSRDLEGRQMIPLCMTENFEKNISKKIVAILNFKIKGTYGLNPAF